MWLYLNDAALSIVAHRTQPAMLLVRSRTKGDIERVFPGRGVTHDPTADYPYRAVIQRKQVAAVLAKRIEAIAYDNFKNSVQDSARHDAYLGVYHAGLRLTSPAARPRPPRRSVEAPADGTPLWVRPPVDDPIADVPELPFDAADWQDEDDFDSDSPTHSRPLGFFR